MPNPQTSKKTIYQLSAEAQALDTLIDQHLEASEGEITLEVEAIINGWLDEHGSQLADKLDAYAAVINERATLAASRKAEAQRFAALAKTDEVLVANLKDRLRWFFESRGLPKYETTQHKFTLAANGGKAPLRFRDDIDVSTLPIQFQRVSVEVDKDAVRAHLENGGSLEWATLDERGNSIRIR